MPTALPDACLRTCAGAPARRGGEPETGSRGRPPAEQADDESTGETGEGEYGHGSVGGGWHVVRVVGVGEGLLDQAPAPVLGVGFGGFLRDFLQLLF